MPVSRDCEVFHFIIGLWANSSLLLLHNPNIVQAYSEVPSTPLHTAAVLREEEENWQDVKVNCY